MAVHNPGHGPEHKLKFNNSLIAIASIFTIFLITYFAIIVANNRIANSVANANVLQGADSAGLASGVIAQDAASSVASCKLIVGQTTLYDDTTLAVTLEAGSSTYYAGYSVSVTSVNDNGCVVDINGNSDYLAIGQIQRLGSLYVTVKDVVK